MPLFHAVNLAARFDIAIMSTKGMPVTACRELADVLCGQYDIPLLVLRDFDKAGFSILGTLQGLDRYDQNCNPIAPRYEFQNDLDVIDLGLRLEDVQKYGLETEKVYFKSSPRPNLRDNGATEEELAFLYPHKYGGGYGSRVELNAFTSGDFVDWIEGKLKQHGIKKIIPDDETLTMAYQRAVFIAKVEERLDEILEEVGAEGEGPVPKRLKHTVRRRLKRTPEKSWDEIVTELAEET